MESEHMPKTHRFLPTLHFLFGCRFDVLVRLLWHNRRHILLRRLPQMFWLLLASLILWPFALLEELFCCLFVYPRRLKQDPVFVLGHWRSGTTYLHNLLCCDPSLAYFDPAAAYTPSNYLLLSPVIRLVLGGNLQQARHMDNMDYGVNSPSEEGFAVSNRMSRAFMHLLTFPQQFQEYLDYAFVDSLSPSLQRKNAGVYRRLYQKVSFKNGGRRLALKSPDHTCHARWLAQEYPGAKFIHIYRNPYKVIQSTLNMIRQAMEFLPLSCTPSQEEMEDGIIDLYVRIHQTLFRDMESIPPERLVELKYEEFVKDPLPHLEQIYDRLDLEGFAAAEPRMRAHIQSQQGYQKNRFSRDEKLIAKINKKAAFVFAHYGYEMEDTESGLSEQA